MGLEEPWLYEDALTAITSAMPDAFENGSIQDLISGVGPVSLLDLIAVIIAVPLFCPA